MSEKNGSKRNYSGHFLSVLAFSLLTAGLASWLFFSQNLNLTISWLDFLVLSLAVFRLTHLLVFDLVFDFIRHYYKKRGGLFATTTNELLYCPWCVSIWLGVLVVFFYLWIPQTFYIFLALAFSAVASLLETISSRLINSNHQNKEDTHSNNLNSPNNPESDTDQSN